MFKNIYSLTFVVVHLLGLHGKGSHHKTHVDFWLQTRCVCSCVCVCIRVFLPASNQGVLVSVRALGVCVCVM